MTSASSSAKPPETPPSGPTSTAPAANGAPAGRPDNGHREAISGLPSRPLPAPAAEWLRHGETPAEGQPVVLLHQTALLQIHAHSRSRLDAELGGALLGHAYRYKGSVVVEVKAALPAVSSDHGPVHFTFSADSWSRLHRDRTAHYAQLDIVGWFHTHPDLGVFYSSDDVVVHSAAFTLPWHVGLVVDPVRDEAAFFGWVDGALTTLNGFYELRDRQPETVVPWRAVRTAVYDRPYEPEPAPESADDTPSRVVLSRSARPRFSARELGLAASAGALLLSFFLIVAGVQLTRRVDLLETTVLNLAQSSPTQSNALACPDPRLRILAPLTGTSFTAGARIPLVGTADYPGARRYQIDVRPAGTETWTLLDRHRGNTTLGQLALWDTTELPAGQYELRLAPVDLNNIRLTDSSPCAITLGLMNEN
ncbi:MAG: Mov34/MPN/PAD-1 family protein [Candidatus Promineofilum sp.]|mgnify:CR=1 FL=1|nr:Mov34/MPN/PAD-1 family protein [Promineifilum sp.]MCW5864528.1 Mov34/MPN/PAD-1 family protein [Anaerolineae bacterium]